MGSTIETGINWSIDDGTIDIFGAKGEKDSPTSWRINGLNLGSSVMLPATPESVAGDIAEIIAADRRAGNEHKIAYIAVGARQAVILYLEGILMLEALEAAEETTETITATITLDGVERKLRITAQEVVDMATYDAEGQVV